MFIEAKYNGSGGDNWSHKTCKAMGAASLYRSTIANASQVVKHYSASLSGAISITMPLPLFSERINRIINI